MATKAATPKVHYKDPQRLEESSQYIIKDLNNSEETPPFKSEHKAKDPRALPKQAVTKQNDHDKEPHQLEETPTFNSGRKAKDPRALPKQA